MTLYHSLDADTAGEQPSYAKLAARLKLNPTYQHPAQQALLDKMATGELNSEECLYQLQQDIIQRTTEKVEHEKQLKKQDTEEQQLLQQGREKLDAEIAQNANADEPRIIDTDTAAAEEDSSATPPEPNPTPSATSGSGSSSASSQQAVSGPEVSGGSANPDYDDMGAFDIDTPPTTVGDQELEDERDERFED